MAGGGAEGLLIYPFLCLEAVFTEISSLGTKGIHHQSHSSRDSILHQEKWGPGRLCLRPHLERFGSPWTQVSMSGLAFVILEVCWAWLGGALFGREPPSLSGGLGKGSQSLGFGVTDSCQSQLLPQTLLLTPSSRRD